MTTINAKIRNQANKIIAKYNGEAVENSRFVYQAYEMPESDNIEYNMYIS